MTEPPRKGEADCETPSVLRQNVPVFILPIFALLWIANVGASWLIRWPSDAVGSSHPLTGEELGVAAPRLRPGNPEVPALPGARTPRPLLTPARKRGGAEERRATPTSGKGAGLQARARPALAGLPGHARSGPRREAHADRRACTPTRDTRAHAHSPKQTYKHAHGRRAHTHRHTCKRAHVRTRVGQTRADTSTRRQTPGTTAAYSQAGTRVCKHMPSQAVRVMGSQPAARRGLVP